MIQNTQFIEGDFIDFNTPSVMMIFMNETLLERMLNIEPKKDNKMSKILIAYTLEDASTNQYKWILQKIEQYGKLVYKQNTMCIIETNHLYEGMSHLRKELRPFMKKGDKLYTADITKLSNNDFIDSLVF